MARKTPVLVFQRDKKSRDATKKAEVTDGGHKATLDRIRAIIARARQVLDAEQSHEESIPRPTGNGQDQ